MAADLPMHLPSEVATKRLVLRRVQSSDVASLVALLEDGPSRQFLGGPLDHDTASDRAKRMIGASGAWMLVSSSDEQYVGLVTLTPHDLGLELSYQLFEEFWGEGLAMEATSAVLGAARDGSSQRIVAITRANKDSRKLLGRLGFSEKEEFVEFGEVQLLCELPR